MIDKKFGENNNGLFTHNTDELEHNLFKIFKYLTGNKPIAQNILVCTKMTSNEEITVFLYRALLCYYNSCFIITGLESLGIEAQETIINLLDNYYMGKKERKEIKSCLIFLFGTKNSDIYKSFELKKYRKFLKINEDDYKNITYEENDIEIIKSDRSGVGKSTKIKFDILNNKKTRIYFPVGGACSQEKLLSRLKSLKIDDNSVLHLDLNDSDKIVLMLEFLLSILILRFYGQNEDIFFLPKNIPIKIEVPNTFINFFEKFIILKLFKITEIKIDNLAPLIVPENINCNIEIVANYLKALNENGINEYDLIFEGITPQDLVKN